MSYGYGMGGPPHGVPIPVELHEQYSDVLKAAWDTFDAWLKTEAEADEIDGLIPSSSMSEDVKKAMDLICKTPIPGHEEATGVDSCYMVTAMSQMKED